MKQSVITVLSIISIVCFCFYVTIAEEIGRQQQQPVGNQTSLFWGQCPQKKVVGNFEISSFLGTWYTYSIKNILFHEQFFGKEVKCLSSSYYMIGENHIRFYFTGRLSILPMAISLKGRGSLPIKDEGKLDIECDLPVIGGTWETEYWILDTDYKNWALVWFCEDFNYFNIQLAAVLTRKRQLSDPEDSSVVKEFTAAIEKASWNKDDFTKVIQYRC